MTPVRMIVGRVVDGRERDAFAVLDQGLGEGEPPAAAGDHEPQLALVLSEFLEQRGDLGFERLALHRQLDGGGRALQAVVVLIEGEGAPGVQPDHLEDAVAAEQAVVGGRDARIRSGRDLAVDAG